MLKMNAKANEIKSNPSKTVDIRPIVIGIIFLYLLTYLVTLAIAGNPDSDMWWMMSTGKYILENGSVPTENPFVIHEGFGIIVQQWALAVFNYLLYTFAGKWGMVVFSLLNIAANLILVWKLSSRYTQNKYVNCVSVLIGMWLFSCYANTRPTQLTTTILLMEQLIILDWIKTKNNQKLWGIVWLSIADINIHAALWPYLFILLLPYVVPSIFHKEPPSLWFKKRGPLMICGAISMFAGLINPNGIKGVLYLFYSYGSGKITEKILELQSPSFSELYGLTTGVSLCVLAVYVYNQWKKDKNLASLNATKAYMLAGTLLLAMMHRRNVWVLIFGLTPVVCELLSENGFFKNEKSVPLKELPYTVMKPAVFFIVLVIIASSHAVSVDPENIGLTEMADYLDTKENVVLYTNFNTGGYMEWRGYRVYMDARPELFMKKINGVADIADESYDVEYGEADYDSFVEKYGFSHIIATQDGQFDIYLQTKGEYSLVMENSSYVLYEK